MHHSSHQLDIRHSHYSDLHDVAHSIQNSLQDVLREPEAGVYLPNQLEPVMRAGYPYWYQEAVFLSKAQPERTDQSPSLNPILEKIRRSNNQPWQYYRYNYIRVENFEQVLTTPWDVVDMGMYFYPPPYNPNDAFPGTDAQPRSVVLPRHLAAMASLRPTLPWAGIKIAYQIIENEIASTRQFNKQARSLLIEEIIAPFISEAYLDPRLPERAKVEHLRSDPWFNMTFNGIFEHMLLVLQPIRNALRHNGYQMCTVNYLDGYELRIDQLGDHRIHEWECITRDPAYQRFLQAKADGSWDRFVSEQDEARSRDLAHDPQSIYR
jgi:hypothetical protein